MFYKKDLMKMKFFIFNNWHNDAQVFQHRYVFVEDDNEILSLHGTPIEMMQPFANATGQIVKIWTTPDVNYPNLFIIRILRHCIRFQPIAYSTETNVLKRTFIGGYDMNSFPITSVTSSDSLAPSITITDQIFVTDLAMKSSPTYFLDQFVPMLWIIFLASFLLCGLILNFGGLCLRNIAPSGLFNSFSWVSLIAHQGGETTSKFNSRNIVLITLGILTIIFHDSFEAFLSSSLSIRVLDIPFSDLNGLLSSKDYTICTIPHTAAHDYVTTTKNIKINVQHNSDECPPFFRKFHIVTKSSQVNLTRCPDGKFAYMGFGRFWNRDWDGQCNILPLAEKYFTEYITINVSPGFKYRKHFNMGVLRLRSGGHLHHLVAWYEQFGYFTAGLRHGRYKYIDQRKNDIESIDLSQTIIIQMILLAGIFISTLVCLAEILIKHLL